MFLLHKISDGLDWFVRKAITFALVWMTLVMIFQVAGRHFLDIGITWTEEMAKYTMVWMIFLANSVASRDGTQMKVTVLEEAFPSIRPWLVALQRIISLIYFAIVVKIGIDMVGNAMNQTSPNMGISMGIVYSVIPAACALMFLHTLSRLVKRAPDPLNEPESQAILQAEGQADDGSRAEPRDGGAGKGVGVS